ncbi:MAG: GUN4 domain-containing protein [Okeania sp. SIO3B5]|nr:GUN4 domain-containing protein [Okeania sp. SIO3B5]
MTPQFEPVQEGYRIYLASSPQDDPKLKYRRKVQEILGKNNGDIDFMNRFLLEELCNRYGISYEEAKEIETEEKEPYIQFHKKLKRYEIMFSQVVEKSYPFTKKEWETLREIQLILGLRDEDIADIKKRFLPESSESESETSPQSDEIELLSDKNVDYTKLRDFLANEEWKEADMETARCMLKVAEREKQGYLEIEDIENFPFIDLCTIDRLWVKYSGGKFGFSVQKKIYQNFRGTKQFNVKIWKKFGDKVGWRKGGILGIGKEWCDYKDLTFDINTHYTGYLPIGGGLDVGLSTIEEVHLGRYWRGRIICVVYGHLIKILWRSDL